MSTLVSIGAPGNSAPMAAHQISTLPVVVIFPHNQCNCRCVMCNIRRIREAKEITPADLDRQLSSFRKLGVRFCATMKEGASAGLIPAKVSDNALAMVTAGLVAAVI